MALSAPARGGQARTVNTSSDIFLTWGVFGIQLGNLIVIVAMLAVFVLALVLPFPGSRGRK